MCPKGDQLSQFKLYHLVWTRECNNNNIVANNDNVNTCQFQLVLGPPRYGQPTLGVAKPLRFSHTKSKPSIMLMASYQSKLAC